MDEKRIAFEMMIYWKSWTNSHPANLGSADQKQWLPNGFPGIPFKIIIQIGKILDIATFN